MGLVSVTMSLRAMIQVYHHPEVDQIGVYKESRECTMASVKNPILSTSGWPYIHMYVWMHTYVYIYIWWLPMIYTMASDYHVCTACWLRQSCLAAFCVRR